MSRINFNNNAAALAATLAISAGRVPGLSVINKFGFASDIDSTLEDIWDQGTVWVAPTTARLHNITSTDADDTSAGTGAQTVTIQGLDASGEEQEETVSMNGTSDVPTVNTYTMIHRMFVATSGSQGENDGDITATAQTDGTVTAQITAEQNQSLMAIYRVPTDKTAYMTNYYSGFSDLTGGGSASCLIKLRVNPSGDDNLYQTKHLKGIIANGQSDISHTFDPPFKVDAGSIIKLSANASTVNQSIYGGFDLVLEG